MGFVADKVKDDDWDNAPWWLKLYGLVFWLMFISPLSIGIYMIIMNS